MMIPSLTDSSPLYAHYDRITGGKSLIESGHPAVMIPCSWSSTGSALVSFFIILFLIMLSRSCFIQPLSAIGFFLGASVCGCMFLLTDSLTAPDMEPILSNWSGYICIRSLVAFICVAVEVWNASSFLTVK